ncbi:MAG: zinc ribbon domain-containing protein [Deltaproteobacteria bacterium]|nr:zinc ribbon domain-containing protein [Deltaproteobacteria bacterium]
MERIGPCPNCASEIDTGAFAIGERAVCPACQSAFRVEVVSARGAPAVRLVACAGCGSKLDVSAFEPGDEAACPECGAVALVPPFAPRALAPPTEISVLATIGALLALVAAVVHPAIALVGLAFSLAAFVDIERRRGHLTGRRRAAGGALANVVILLLYLMLVPRPLPDAFYDDDDEARLRAKLEVVSEERRKSGANARAGYADSLAPLLVYDPNLAADGGVTFIFGSVDSEGYTFTTIHALGTRERGTRSGRREFVFHD